MFHMGTSECNKKLFSLSQFVKRKFTTYPLPSPVLCNKLKLYYFPALNSFIIQGILSVKLMVLVSNANTNNFLSIVAYPLFPLETA